MPRAMVSGVICVQPLVVQFLGRCDRQSQIPQLMAPHQRRLNQNLRAQTSSG